MFSNIIIDLQKWWLYWQLPKVTTKYRPNWGTYKASGGVGISHFILPKSNDFTKNLQDPKNPITTNKVALGNLLYHETGLAKNPMKEISKGTYSCASCHFASAGFQAGRFQGIADGGVGFGVNGEVLVKGSLYDGDELDLQPIQTPTAMNGAYQKVMLWNGQFGGTSVNIGLKLNGLQIHQEKLII